MNDHDPGKLQIYAVEEVDSMSATCIARCVGGVVRPGQLFNPEPLSGNPSEIALDWIDQYQRRVDFIDPPHSAKVHFSGGGVSLVEKGVTIVSV
ncbi:hypothetical protein [Streptomyces sp. NPDC087859]|jgi:hypothetical protein|uniref:hypothetical protein n=1 Tax=Streptomyces sp. NPDC087859 TaxID=3365812 RepID=UPI003815DC4A